MSDLIHANELIGILHNTEYKDGDDRSIVYNIIQNIPAVDACPNDKVSKDMNMMLAELDYWQKKCEKYESTIVKMAVLLMERKEE